MISFEAFRARILAALIVVLLVCYGGARLATAQYSPAGGNTFGGATYPLNVADAAGLTGPVPVLSGGTGISIGCGSPTTTCGPCQIPGTYYWNADVNVVLDGGSPFTWTDVCSGVVTAPITTSPTYTSNCLGTHYCMTYTKSTAMAMNQADAAGFPAIATPYTYGDLFAGVGGLTTNTYMLDFGPTQGLVGVLHTTAGALDCNNSTSVVAPVPYQNTKLALLLCFQVSGLTGLGGAEVLSAGAVAGTSATGGTHSPGGGITIGNTFNGQDASGGADGKILSVIVATHSMTELERAGYVAWEQNYWGGI